MHASHLRTCAVGVVLALAFVAFSGPSTGGIALLVAALACPISMIVAMRFLMGSGHESPRPVDPVRRSSSREP